MTAGKLLKHILFPALYPRPDCLLQNAKPLTFHTDIFGTEITLRDSAWVNGKENLLGICCRCRLLLFDRFHAEADLLICLVEVDYLRLNLLIDAEDIGRLIHVNT